MAVFRDPAALRRHIEKAAAEQIKEALITSQAWLGNSNNVPFDSGRMRSSWFATENEPSNEAAPDGANAPQTDAQGLEVQIDRDYHLTNNLPYAQPIALGVNLPPSWGGEHRVVSAPKTWFIDFVNSELPKIGDVAGRVIKRRFDL